MQVCSILFLNVFRLIRKEVEKFIKAVEGFYFQIQFSKILENTDRKNVTSFWILKTKELCEWNKELCNWEGINLPYYRSCYQLIKNIYQRVIILHRIFDERRGKVWRRGFFVSPIDN
jgi:hypothetical protein